MWHLRRLGEPMTRSDLARALHDAHGGLTYPDARALVDQVISAISEGLVSDGHVVLSGFGTFRVVRRKPRLGRNIARGERVVVPSRNALVFVPSRNLTGRGR